MVLKNVATCCVLTKPVCTIAPSALVILHAGKIHLSNFSSAFRSPAWPVTCRQDMSFNILLTGFAHTALSINFLHLEKPLLDAVIPGGRVGVVGRSLSAQLTWSTQLPWMDSGPRSSPTHCIALKSNITLCNYYFYSHLMYSHNYY